MSKPLHVLLEESIHLRSGDFFHYDFRSDKRKEQINNHHKTRKAKPLKVLQWNIERGYKLHEIIESLRTIDADIIALQEVDVGCSRSEYIDTGIAIAHTLGYNYIYQNEFHELESDIYKKQYIEKYNNNSINDINNTTSVASPAEGSIPSFLDEINTIDLSNYQQDYKTDPSYHPIPQPTKNTTLYNKYFVQSNKAGCHGNAILTKFDIVNYHAVEHPIHSYNWDNDGILLNEPRIGQRQTLCATLAIPNVFVVTPITDREIVIPIDNNNTNDDNSNSYVNVSIYTCHLELFCGIKDRLIIYSDIMRDFDKYNSNSKGSNTIPYNNIQYNNTYSMILGDFNTLAHSIARLSKKYCKDTLRYKTLGWTEAEWWYAYVLDYTINTYYNDNNIDIKQQLKSTLTSSHIPYNQRLQSILPDLSQQTLQYLVNPGFEEPYPANTETLTNYNGWFYGKLDWTLLYNIIVTKADMMNMDYTASDHRGMYIEVFLTPNKRGYKLSSNSSSSSEVIASSTSDSSSCSSSQQQQPLDIYSSIQDNTITHIQFSSLISNATYDTTYVSFPVIKDHINGYYIQHNTINGYIIRNMTPYVSKILFWFIGIVIALFAMYLSLR